MAKASGVLCSPLFAALFFFASVMLVKSLPTSILVDTKQHHQQHDQIERQPSSMSAETLNTEKEAALVTKNPTTLEHENPITVNKAQTKFQKRGVKQSYFEPNHLNDIQLNSNAPAGVWDDPDVNVYPDVNDFEDYQFYQPAFTSPYHSQRNYENLAQILEPDNLYEEPRALPVKYQYPRYLDERQKRGINKNIQRLKRDSTKLNTADMLKLLEFLERNPHNHHDNEIEENINALDYQKPFYGLSPYSRYGAIAAAFEPDNDDVAVNGGEWLNDWVEPSVQYYGNSPYGIYDPNSRDRYAASKVFPAKRFMVAKKKRSLNAHSAMDNTSTKSKFTTNFEHRFANNAQRF